MPQFREGDHVKYHPVGGRTGTPTSTGMIERVLTEPDTAGSRRQFVSASKDDPRYEVRNDYTGKKSAIKEENIEKVLEN